MNLHQSKRVRQNHTYPVFCIRDPCYCAKLRGCHSFIGNEMPIKPVASKLGSIAHATSRNSSKTKDPHKTKVIRHLPRLWYYIGLHLIIHDPSLVILFIWASGDGRSLWNCLAVVSCRVGNGCSALYPFCQPVATSALPTNRFCLTKKRTESACTWGLLRMVQSNASSAPCQKTFSLSLTFQGVWCCRSTMEDQGLVWQWTTHFPFLILMYKLEMWVCLYPTVWNYYPRNCLILSFLFWNSQHFGVILFDHRVHVALKKPGTVTIPQDKATLCVQLNAICQPTTDGDLHIVRKSLLCVQRFPTWLEVPIVSFVSMPWHGRAGHLIEHDRTFDLLIISWLAVDWSQMGWYGCVIWNKEM